MNKDIIDQIVTRVVEHFIGPTQSQVHISGAEDTMRKLSKSDANYRKAAGDQRCGDCQFFQPPACEIVEGEIEAGDVCDRWQEVERFYVPISKSDNETLVFPVGIFYRDGKQREFTAEQAEEMVKNFKTNILGRNNGWLPINREHERDKGRIGYITDLILRDGAPYAKIEPVDGYEDELRGFDYISPEIRWEWAHPYTGQEYASVLMGAAATNYPFLLGKTAIVKSLFLIDGEWYAVEEDSPAMRNWEENWQDMLPKSGKGRFVHQRHYRGLSEEESKLSDEALLKLGKSVHGDIRLTGNGKLWGWTVFKDDFMDGGSSRVVPKSMQPKAWLRVGRGKGTVAKPGEAGSTARTFSKFFIVDEGNYRLGVARQHAIELFLGGKKLKGRHSLQFTPLGEVRKWTINRPDDQRPYIKSHDKEKIIAELKRKGQKWLFWGDGKDKPEIIDIGKAKIKQASEFVHQVSFSRFSDHDRIASGIVLQPDIPDAQDHVMSVDEIEATAHRFSERMKLDLHHERDVAPNEARVVESWIQKEPVTWHFTIDGEERITEVPVGTWCASVQFGEERWSEVLSGEIAGFSPQGWGMLI